MTPEEREAIEALIDFHYERPGESYIEWRERWDDVFYRATGMLAPGKDDVRGSHTHEERRAAFRAWVDAERADRVAAVRTALASAPQGEPKDPSRCSLDGAPRFKGEDGTYGACTLVSKGHGLAYDGCKDPTYDLRREEAARAAGSRSDGGES